MMHEIPEGAGMTWRGAFYPYFVHNYNTTYANERAIEVPLAFDYIEQASGPVLEVGNVLSHYRDDIGHTVVDKCEKWPGVINEDIEDYKPSDPFGLVVSVSTLEHVGWNEYKYGPGAKKHKDPEKLGRVLERIRAMLAPGGVFMTTMPIGYNDGMDERLGDGRIVFDEMHWFLRTGKTEWELSDAQTVLQTKYGSPYTSANGLFVGVDHAQSR